MILVSACLLGENCKYSGSNNLCPEVVEYLRDKEHLPFCPELMGGLSTPRPPCERIGARVMNKEGVDVTAEFMAGAQATAKLCRERDIDRAILKEGSPSCGVHLIYDGSFNGHKIPGQGITAALLAENGVDLVSEDDIKALVK